MKRMFAIVALLAAPLLVNCGGSGSGGSGGGGGGPAAPSVSGDMLGLQTSRGWNYHGSGGGIPAATVSIYADPPQSGLTALVLYLANGTVADAFSGTKAAGIGITQSGGANNVAAYVLLDDQGGIYAQGAISPIATLVPATLTQGAVYTPYPGATATVTAVGTVPGASACPTPATGATVQVTFMGQTYSVSYVPGCGITQYIGNHGETFTLSSVGSYPALGTQMTTKMSSLTLMDNVTSLAHVIASGAQWKPFASLK